MQRTWSVYLPTSVYGLIADIIIWYISTTVYCIVVVIFYPNESYCNYIITNASSNS